LIVKRGGDAVKGEVVWEGRKIGEGGGGDAAKKFFKSLDT